MEDSSVYKTYAFMCSLTWRIVDGALIRECKDIAVPEALIAVLEYAPMSSEFDKAGEKITQLVQML